MRISENRPDVPLKAALQKYFGVSCKVYSDQKVTSFSSRQQHTFFQMAGHVRVRGRVRIVGYHDDCLLKVLV